MINNMQQKYCNHCLTEHQLSDEYWYFKKGKVNGCKQHAIQYRLKNKQKRKEWLQLYLPENRNKIIEYRKQYYQSNKDKIVNKSKEYYELNKERVIENGRIYQSKRRKNDPYFRLVCSLRSRHIEIVRKLMTLKCKSTESGLGCSFFELRVHIESKFTNGMCWNNYGSVWHLDHIVPLAYFDLRYSEEQDKAFHYTNLRPLLVSDNIKKNSYYNGVRYRYKDKV